MEIRHVILKNPYADFTPEGLRRFLAEQTRVVRALAPPALA